MNQHFSTNVVGYSNIQVDRWAAIVQSLIEDMDGNELIFREMKNLSKRQLGCIDDNAIPNGRAYFDCLENNFDEIERIDFLINLATYMEHHIELGTVRVADLLKTHSKNLKLFREQCKDEGFIIDKNFIGRKENMETIEQKFITGDTFGLCICGLGGLGKTSLAREVCIRLWKRKDKWEPKKIDLRGVENLKDILRDTLMKFGESCWENDVEELRQRLFNKIKYEIKTKTILVFDNIDDSLEKDEDTIQRFLMELLNLLRSKGNGCKIRILVTSRQKLLLKQDTSIKTIMPEMELKSLNERDSIKLLKKCTKRVSMTQDEAREIVQRCGCSPLAIRTLSSSLKSRLITPRQIIINLKSGFEKTSITETLNVKNCIQQTFGAMDTIFQRKLIQVSVFRTTVFDVKSASAILGTADEVTTMDLLYLKSRHLIEADDLHSDSTFCDEPNTTTVTVYSLHPIIDAFLKEKVQNDNHQTIYMSARIRFVEYFDEIAQKAGKEKDKNFHSFQKIVDKYRPHLSVYFEILHSVASGDANFNFKTPTHSLISNKRLSDTISFMLDDSEMIEFSRKTSAAAFKVDDNLKGTFWKLEEGIALLESERIDEAGVVIDNIEETCDIKRTANDEINATILGKFFYFKGRFCIHKGMYDEALACLNQAEQLYKVKNIKKDFKFELARVHNSIGTVYFRSNPSDIASAKFHQTQALHLAERFCEDSNPDVANYMANVAVCLYQEGIVLKKEGKDATEKFNAAMQLYDGSLKLDLNLNRHKTQVKDYAMKLLMRANIHQALNHFENALDDNKRALELRQSVFQEPHDLITISTHRIGNILRLKALNDYKNGKDVIDTLKEAVSYYDKAMALIAEGGLSRNCEDEYVKIRDEHQWLAQKVHDSHTQRKIEVFYSDYQSGRYDRQTERNRQISRSMAGSVQSFCDPSQSPHRNRTSSLHSNHTSSPSSSSSSSPNPYSASDSEINLDSDQHEDIKEMESNIASVESCLKTIENPKETLVKSSNELSLNEYNKSSLKSKSSSLKQDTWSDQPYHEPVRFSSNLSEEQSYVCMGEKSKESHGFSSNQHQLPTATRLQSDTNLGSAEQEADAGDSPRRSNHSLTYQSSMEDEVFTTPDRIKPNKIFFKRGSSSGYSSGYSASSTSENSLAENETTSFSRNVPIKRSLSVPAIGPVNKEAKSSKLLKRSSSQNTQLNSFIDKLLKKPKIPKVSKGLLGDSFDEEEEDAADC